MQYIDFHVVTFVSGGKGGCRVQGGFRKYLLKEGISLINRWAVKGLGKQGGQKDKTGKGGGGLVH